MSWGFRKSKMFGPFRVTAGARGLSVSAGGPLGRVSLNSRGEIRQTTRVPGVGLYETHKVGQIGGASGSRSSAASIELPSSVLMSVATNLVGTSGKILSAGQPDVESLKVVSLRIPAVQVAELCGISVGADGFRHSGRSALVMPVGDEWHVAVLVTRSENPALFHRADQLPHAYLVGRLSVRDVRLWQGEFAQRNLYVQLTVEATPGLEHLEVLFHPSILADEPTPAVTAPAAPEVKPPLPPAGWYADPADEHQWRWWDGSRWSVNTSPRAQV